MKISEDEVSDLEYVINTLVARHTITIEFLAHLAETKNWNVKTLRNELENKGFLLEYKDEKDELVNIQEAYEKLYDLSVLTEAEQNILEAFALFPYISLATDTCNYWLLTDAKVKAEDDILKGLYRKGWLQFDMNQDGYALHPVFAQFIFEKCKPEPKNHYGLFNECRKSLEISIEDTVERCMQYKEFAYNILKKMNLFEDPKLLALKNTLSYVLKCLKGHFETEISKSKKENEFTDTMSKFYKNQKRELEEKMKNYEKEIKTTKEMNQLEEKRIKIMDGLAKLMGKIDLKKLDIKVCEEFIVLAESAKINSMGCKECEKIIGLLENVDMENLDNKNYESFIDILKSKQGSVKSCVHGK